MIPFLKVKGIRQRWLLNSISILVMILVVVVAAFSLIIKNYYDSSILTDMESKARMAASYFRRRPAATITTAAGIISPRPRIMSAPLRTARGLSCSFSTPGAR